MSIPIYLYQRLNYHDSPYSGLLFFCMTLDPLFGCFLKRCAVGLVLIGNISFHGIVSVHRQQPYTNPPTARAQPHPQSFLNHVPYLGLWGKTYTFGSSNNPLAISNTDRILQLGFQFSALKIPRHIDPLSSLLTFGW